MLSIVVLVIVFILIAVRQVGSFRLRIWQIMLLGAFGVLFTGQVSPPDALKAINVDVILFLFGMFIVGQALKESGYLSHLSCRFFGRAKTMDGLVLSLLFGMGLFSALLMNDTLAIIGTPLVLIVALKNNIKSKVLLLTLAFAITIGSVASPIGNPQNLLIALNGDIGNPFITFMKYLLLPTVLNLLVAYVLIRVYFPDQFQSSLVPSTAKPLTDKRLAGLTQASLGLLILMIAIKVVLVFLKVDFDLRLTYIALIAAAPVVLLSSKRWQIIRRIDWSTLVFFAAMFVLMESVWRSGFFQSAMYDMNLNPASLVVILAVSVVLSQFISNVPLVALYLPMLLKVGVSTEAMMALAAGSTIAGNLSILGAASNVIIIQNAENLGVESPTFLDFIKIGVPLTILNVVIYWLFFLVL